MESFPTAFAIPIGLVKLVQGLWLLDHNDQQVRADFDSKFLLQAQSEVLANVIMSTGMFLLMK